MHGYRHCCCCCNSVTWGTPYAARPLPRSPTSGPGPGAGSPLPPHAPRPMLQVLCFLPPRAQDSAEFGRIGKYYATESMLVWDESIGRYREDLTPGYGKDTLEEFFG